MMTDKTMNVYEKLQAIQTELKAPKGQFNKFGKYKYRSCEDILEAVKPLLAKYGCSLTIEDTIEQIGDRYYVKATAIFRSNDKPLEPNVINTAYAREAETKSGMDASQITGTASSYARKYCLNGLFLIDDTKDADTNEYKAQTDPNATTDRAEEKEEKQQLMATEYQIKKMKEIADQLGKELDEEVAKNMTAKQASNSIKKYLKGETE
jgi:hypothetical protein